VTIRCGMTDDAFVQCANTARAAALAVSIDGESAWPAEGVPMCQAHIDAFVEWANPATGWTPTEGDL
jgi:hypothetical protein